MLLFCRPNGAQFATQQTSDALCIESSNEAPRSAVENSSVADLVIQNRRR